MCCVDRDTLRTLKALGRRYLRLFGGSTWAPFGARPGASGSLFGQLHNSLNGGSLGHGGMEEAPATPLDADTLLVPDPLLNVDTPLDP
jgi:hypothetical protein